VFRHQAIHAFAFPSARDLTIVQADGDASMHASVRLRCVSTFLASDEGSHFHVMTLVNDSIVDMLGQRIE
jgi:hypothetical protein